eukprot:5784254-Prymnesium_polylepis.1
MCRAVRRRAVRRRAAPSCAAPQPTLCLATRSARQVCCYSISAKNAVNIDITLDWLMKHTQSARRSRREGARRGAAPRRDGVMKGGGGVWVWGGGAHEWAGLGRSWPRSGDGHGPLAYTHGLRGGCCRRLRVSGTAWLESWGSARGMVAVGGCSYGRCRARTVDGRHAFGSRRMQDKERSVPVSPHAADADRRCLAFSVFAFRTHRQRHDLCWWGLGAAEGRTGYDDF